MTAEVLTPEAAEQLRGIARIVGEACGKGVGFALFLAAGGNLNYISNGDRADVLTVLEGWLRKTGPSSLSFDVKESGRGGRTFTLKSDKETAHQIDARLALERRCADIGKTIGQVTQLCLFLFNFSEHGNLAYFTNTQDAREGITLWVKKVRTTS